jgi:AraC-like DNA-binding protein
LAFHGETKIEVGKRLEKLVYLDNFGKMIELLCMLQYMAWTKEYTILNAEGYAIEVQNTDNNRINVIYDFVQDRYTGPISLEEIAEITNMTVPSFCRYFKKMSGKKFTQFVNEIRIVHACKLLTESQDSISNISYASGFNNFSHFNRQFKNITGESPSAYRKKITQVLHEV